MFIQVDDSVMGAVAEDAFYQKRPLTKYICDSNPEENIRQHEDFEQSMGQILQSMLLIIVYWITCKFNIL